MSAEASIVPNHSDVKDVPVSSFAIPAGSSLTILIVDHMAANLKLLQSQLEAQGHVVISASNGVEALAVLEREEINIIISDVLMPEMDGYRLCYEVRQNERFQHVPFIFHAATYTSPTDEQLAIDLGADAYLRKPASVDDLLLAINAAAATTRRRPTVSPAGVTVLRQYNEELVTRLQEKTIDLMAAIAERKRAEEELRGTHAQLRQLLEHSPAVIYALTVEGEKITPRLSSDNITRLLGFSVPETLSFDWWFGQLHPEDRDLAMASITETVTHGVSRTEYRLQHKDGSYRWVDDNRRLVRDAQGKPQELVGVWTDITERRQAQEELRVSERRVSDMLRNLQLVAVMLDHDGRITYCNDFLLRLTGWQREDLLGRDWFDVFLPPEIHGELRGFFATVLADTPEARQHENEIVTRSGERRLIHWNNSVVCSGSGEVIGTASIGEDITDRKSLENQLLRAQRMESLGTLAGGIADDLNNLFMPILMGVTLIKRFEPAEGTQKAIENIERCIKRGTDLVKKVLLFARGVEGSKVTVDLASLIAEVEAIAASTFPKNVTLVTAVAGALPQLTGDPTHLTQVLLNLTVNARDALATGGQITVSAKSAEINEQFAADHGGSGAGRYVVLEVADNGSGMPKEVVGRIFEPFFTTKAVGYGTGLGLSTAQGVVRSHGGFMTVSSAVGKGSTFKVYLPANAECAAAAATSRVAEQEIPRGNGELILVVDDEIAILEITRQTLEAFGYKALTAEDGAQAMDLYARHRSKIALVLTDMMMPVIDGATLIKALRRINPEVRIIAVSGMDDTGPHARTVGGETPRFLAKPFTVERMLRTVFEVLGKRRGPPPSEVS